jgi:type I restriction enzyme, R subunit
MNDLFGADAFTRAQIGAFVQGLVQQLLDRPELVNQTRVNTRKQFMESQDFQAAVTEAVVDNQEAHNTMTDYFFSAGPGIDGVVLALADAFYEAASDRRSDQ